MNNDLHRKMAIFDKWHADIDYGKSEELDFNIAYWPQPGSKDQLYRVRLEELTHFKVEERIQARNRNMERLDLAAKRIDIVHLDCHYTCCMDRVQREAIEALVKHDDRDWYSFTMMGINGFGDIYSSSAATLETLFSLFLSLHRFQVLNLHSCTLNRGHGLECILKAIPYFEKLKILRLEGLQMDRITVTTLVESLRWQHTKSISFLSMRSCLFLGEESFAELASGLKHVPQLETLNVSYCNLGDNEIIALVESLQSHPGVERIHLGGNFCHSPQSVDVIADWIQQPSCKLRDLNLRSLWLGFSEEGLVQRFVDLDPIFVAISSNQQLQHLYLSENYLEDREIKNLTTALLSRPKRTLQYLDVGDNPFLENGARHLVGLVSGLRSLHGIRFENHFMIYRTSELVKLLAEFNKFDAKLVGKAVNVPLSLWPQVFAKVQQQENRKDFLPSDTRGTNLLFRLLRSATGPYGNELSWEIAVHYKGN